MAESKNRLGRILIQEGVIDQQIEQRAAEIQARSPGRKFGEILVQDLGVDHHAVFSLLAKTYAFKEFDFEKDAVDEAGIEFIKKTMEDLPDEVREEALEKQVLPLKLLDRQQEMLLVVTPDPSDRSVNDLAMRFGYRRPEICYGRLDVIQSLIEQAFPRKNAFLDILKEAEAPVEVDEGETEGVD